MRSYSPFDASIGHLKPSDLVVLQGVSEGWYVEYKSGSVTSRALAKAISAFANTYGGWLFLGVREKSKGDPVAGSFPGIPNAEVDATLQRLRQCAAEYLNPSPHFLTQTLRGPCDEIGLAPDTSIIAVQVPQSYTAPHVHKDGRIYRRVADSSEPKPESDRFTLDQLWRRADPVRDHVRDWVEGDPEFSKAEEDTPYVRLLLCVDPWGQHDCWLDAPLPRIRSIMMSDSVPFDTFYTTADGFLARQAKNNDPHNFVLTWRIRRDLSCDIVVPLPRYATRSIDLLALELDGYDYAQRFVRILRAQAYHSPRVADLNILMNLLFDFVAKYRCLLELGNAEKREFYFKARVLNVWRLLPFVDVEAIIDEYEKYGLPICMDSEVTYPHGHEPESFKLLVETDKGADVSGDAAPSVLQAQLMFTWIALSLGVPALVEEEVPGKARVVSGVDLVAAGDRALEVQRRRNIRNARLS